MATGRKVEPALTVRLSNRAQAVVSRHGTIVVQGMQALTLTPVEARNLAEGVQEFEEQEAA